MSWVKAKTSCASSIKWLRTSETKPLHVRNSVTRAPEAALGGGLWTGSLTHHSGLKDPCGCAKHPTSSSWDSQVREQVCGCWAHSPGRFPSDQTMHRQNDGTTAFVLRMPSAAGREQVWCASLSSPSDPGDGWIAPAGLAANWTFLPQGQHLQRKFLSRPEKAHLKANQTVVKLSHKGSGKRQTRKGEETHMYRPDVQGWDRHTQT